MLHCYTRLILIDFDWFYWSDHITRRNILQTLICFLICLTYPQKKSEKLLHSLSQFEPHVHVAQSFYPLKVSYITSKAKGKLPKDTFVVHPVGVENWEVKTIFILKQHKNHYFNLIDISRSLKVCDQKLIKVLIALSLNFFFFHWALYKWCLQEV